MEDFVGKSGATGEYIMNPADLSSTSDNLIEMEYDSEHSSLTTSTRSNANSPQNENPGSTRVRQKRNAQSVVHNEKKKVISLAFSIC